MSARRSGRGSGVSSPVMAVGKQEGPKSLLAEALGGGDDDHIVQALASCLQRPDYSIVDLFRDAADVRKRAATGGTAVGQLLKNCVQLDRTMGASLARASTAQEKFIEGTLHAFCELDEKDTVVFANSKMLELVPDCLGSPLPSLFGTMSTQVSEELRSGNRRINQLEIQADGRHHPVLAEFGSYAAYGRQGGFAFLVDMKDAVEAERRALDATPYGMLKIDADHRVVYANPNLLKLMELPLEEVVGRDSREFLQDDESVEEATRQFAERQEGRGGEYELTVTTAKSGRPIRLRVMGCPSYDASGQFAGMLGSVVPIDLELARKEIASLVASHKKYGTLFKELMEVVQRHVDFDWADLSLYTPERDFALSVCRYPTPEREYGVRWFFVDPPHRDIVDRPYVLIDDLKTFLEQTETGRQRLERDEEMQLALKEGRRGLFIFPIRSDEREAVLSLQSKRTAAYDAGTMEILQKLALDQALQAVLNARDHAEKEEFVGKLLSRVATARDLTQLAEIIVEEIAAFYDFRNVSIFKVNVLRGHFSLLAQKVGKQGGKPIPKDYVQPLDKGLLGLTYQRKTYVNLHKRGDDSEEAKAYVAVSDETVSELCIPIELRKRFLWILNLEDPRENAFNKPEIETLQKVVSQINASVDHLFQGTVLTQVLQVFPDAVVLVSKSGNILLANDKAMALFQIDELPEDCKLEPFLSTDDLQTALSEQNEPAWSTSVAGAEGKKTPVLLSKFLLSEEYDHLLVVMKDVTELQWTRDLQRLKAALSEATSQVRVPLSLVSSFVQQIERKGAGSDLAKLASRALFQLSRVELTYDRIFASYDADRLPPARRIPVDINRVVDHILRELPDSDRQAVSWTRDDQTRSVLADPYRVIFALESMLTYLLRSRAKPQPIAVAMERVDNKVVEVSMTGPVEATEVNGALEKVVEQTRMEIALGEPLLKRIAVECGGTFSRKQQPGDQEQLSIRMKLIPD
jgi:PAS domain S-box-containing protein